MKNIILLLLATLLTSALCAAQTPTPAPTSNPAPSPTPVRTLSVGAGEKVVDSDGREVSVPEGASGEVDIQYTGSAGSPDENGCIAIEGTIQEVKNPVNGGASKVDVDTNGKSTKVTIKDSGTARARHDVCVVGGNARVTITGKYNNLTVGGMGNTVSIQGENNTGMGENAMSGGSITVRSGEGNSFSSNGGQWTTV